MSESHRSGAGTDRPDADPREVGGYHLLRRVGEGGMSTVHLSYDVVTDQPVAVKLLADHLAHSREFVNRFYREARLSRLLSHPNLVKGLGAGFDAGAGKHYLVLEYVDGPTAHAVLAARGPFIVGAAVRVGIDIAHALEFLHGRQYVHRDVKPENVLLHPNGGAKLADLGLTKRLNDDAHLTSASQGVGTSYYMAYEQSLNPNFVDGRSDVFALGATLYHLLTGAVPFPGKTHEEVSRGKAFEKFLPADVVNPSVPGALAGIIAKSLARNPRERFQTAGEFAAALEATGAATTVAAPNDDEQVSSPSPEAPTRADLKALDGPCVVPPRRPPSESFVARGVVALPVVAGGSGSWLWVWLSAFIAAAAVVAVVAEPRPTPSSTVPSPESPRFPTLPPSPATPNPRTHQ